MKRHGMSLIQLMCIIALMIFTGAVLWPVTHRIPPERALCQSNLKQIGLAMSQYTMDYDKRMPNVSLSGEAYGWADALQPYLKSTALYHCPTRTRLVADNTGQTNPKKLNYTDYWLNRNLSNLPAKNVTNAAQTICIGEGNDGFDLTTARYAVKSLPSTWLTDENSPAHRHVNLDGKNTFMNVLFMDIHVKALRPETIVTSPSQAPTFALR